MLSLDKARMEDKDAILRFISDASRKIAKEFYFDPRIEEKAVVAHLSEEVTDKLQKGTGFYIKDDSAIRALGIITDATWDSGILNKRVGKLVLYGLLPEEEAPDFTRRVCLKSRKMGFDVIFGRADLENPRVLHMATLPDVILGDILLTLGFNLHGRDYERLLQGMPQVEKPDLIFEEGATADSGKLEKITEFAYKHSHYHNDPNISFAQAEAVYQEWVRNSLRGYADTVVVAKSKEGIVGYVSFRVRTLGENAFGTIDLIAVDEKHRGKGIGRMLVAEGIKKNRNRIDTLLVSTQVSNMPAIRLYWSLGFKPIRSEITFHIWNETRI